MSFAGPWLVGAIPVEQLGFSELLRCLLPTVAHATQAIEVPYGCAGRTIAVWLTNRTLTNTPGANI